MGRVWERHEGRVNPEGHRWLKVGETQDGEYRNAHYVCENGCPTQMWCPVDEDPNQDRGGICFTPFTAGRVE